MVDRGVDQHVAGVAGAQILRLRREAEEGINLGLLEQLDRFD
jgi:hypothetical protein